MVVLSTDKERNSAFVFKGILHPQKTELSNDDVYSTCCTVSLRCSFEDSKLLLIGELKNLLAKPSVTKAASANVKAPTRVTVHASRMCQMYREASRRQRSVYNRFGLRIQVCY